MLRVKRKKKKNTLHGRCANDESMLYLHQRSFTVIAFYCVCLLSNCKQWCVNNIVLTLDAVVRSLFSSIDDNKLNSTFYANFLIPSTWQHAQQSSLHLRLFAIACHFHVELRQNAWIFTVSKSLLSMSVRLKFTLVFFF